MIYRVYSCWHVGMRVRLSLCVRRSFLVWYDLCDLYTFPRDHLSGMHHRHTCYKPLMYDIGQADQDLSDVMMQPCYSSSLYMTAAAASGQSKCRQTTTACAIVRMRRPSHREVPYRMLYTRASYLTSILRYLSVMTSVYTINNIPGTVPRILLYYSATA